MKLTRVVTVIAGFVLAACQSDRTVTSHEPRISADISDGSHCVGTNVPCVLGNAHFFFLPPMVKAPTTTGTFNPILAPSVTICRLLGNACVAGTSFSPGAAQVDVAAQQYKVNWNTDPTTVIAGQIYRIVVSTSGADLGFADVVPMSNGSLLKNLDTGEFIGLVDGRTLPIRFRIEQGATCSGRVDCLEQTVGPNPGARLDVVTPPTFLAAVSFPPGYLTQAVTLTIAQVPEGCFTPSSPSPSFTDHGCYSFTTSPRVDNPLNCTAQPGEAPATPDDLVRCARVEVCPTLASGDPNYHNLRMFKSDPGTPVQELPEAPALLLLASGACPQFVPPGGGDGLGLASNRWHGIMNAIGRLVMPRPLFAANAMAHTGLGGMTCCFSNIGWALTARFDNVSAPLALDIGGLEGTATVSVSNGTGAPASGLEVKGFIVQGTARRSAGTSLQTNGLFTCASGTCTLKGFNFVANNALDGTGTLVCGPASAEFDLMQDSTLVQTTTTLITLSNRGGCGE